jgi:hypothetical protein
MELNTFKNNNKQKQKQKQKTFLSNGIYTSSYEWPT